MCIYIVIHLENSNDKRFICGLNFDAQPLKGVAKFQ
jgi:hypothetical protein